MKSGVALALLFGCGASHGGCGPSRGGVSPEDLALNDDDADLAPASDEHDGAVCAIDSNQGLVDLIDAVVAKMRLAGGAGSDALVVPAANERDAFAARVVAILGGDDAQACALPSSYRLLRLSSGHRVVAEVDGDGAPAPSLLWGTYAAPLTPPVPSRRLAIEAPHPIFDADTEREAADLFVQTGARWLLVAGAHRCANAAASGCSGTTSACGTDANYRISDAAHAVQLPFWAVHAQLSTADAQLAFLQLHGNAASCPAALVSDSSGTWSDTGYARTLAAALSVGGVAVGKCGLGFPTTACNLRGTDNAEARATAAASDACTMRGTLYGRFVHVEQQAGLRAAYQPLIDATRVAFAAQ